MATLVLSAVGAAAGGSLGGGVLGLGSAVIGRAVGATLGRVIDQSLIGGGSEAVETGRVDRFRLTAAGEGTAVSKVYGRLRIGGQVIWASRFLERSRSSGGGKGAPQQPEIREYSYSVSLALGLCEGAISRIGRIWADGKEIARESLVMQVYPGDERQLPDPKIEAVEGQGNAPAYRGLAYVVIEDLDLGRFGNRVPQFTFEVMKPEPETSQGAPDMARAVKGVAMMPGTGEYSLATTPVYFADESGLSQPINVNSPLGRTDFLASLAALKGELPNCASTSLIVSWFGDDLRCGACSVAPKVEQTEFDGDKMPWIVSGLQRTQAEAVPRVDGKVIYGGTPTDQSVVQAIQALHEAGQAVMFYPFLLMEQLDGNGRADPYSDLTDQPVLPWRGRITLSKAPGRDGSPDGTEQASREVAEFFGTAEVGDFSVVGESVRYVGPEEFSYRRFILHYAHLCAAAGGVDSFCIGSEMRGLTAIRNRDGFPAVDALRRLATDVREILGPGTKIGYAADWSEYFGHRPDDGTGDVYFHLDPLWADNAIDFVGIDNYMPLADWRDGFDHADSDWGSIYDLDYLKSNIEGGKGFDWFYPTAEAAAAQQRSPIVDGFHGEHWIYRYKDIRSWWSLPHHERRNGVRSPTPSAWVPQSKPIWFTEVGCAAIDKGANQPNKFIDPKSSESRLPNFSNGRRDDLMQMQFLRALYDYWSDAEMNPTSAIYGRSMIDVSRIHVWAWDARPYPFFPGNAELWSDGENYTRGHWITGRSTARSLSSVVAEICSEAGIVDIDVDALYGIVRGYQVADLGGARAALQPLMLASGFDAIERDGRLIFRSRDGRVTDDVLSGDLAVSGELDGDIEAVRSPEAERIGRLRLTYIDADGDYGAATSEAIFPDDRSFSVAQSEFPLALTRGEGKAVTERWLAEARVARDRLRFCLPPSRMDLGAGDVVNIAGGHYRIDHVEQGTQRLIEAQRVEREVYVPSSAIDDGPHIVAYRAPVPVLPVFLDLPLLTGDETPHAPHVAATARPWPGPVAVYSSATEDGFAMNIQLPRRAVIGITETSLHAARAGVYDHGAPLRVRLIRGALGSVGEEALLSGANTMAIGTGRDDVWEVFQFSDAMLVGLDVYDVSARLRGQLGTDALMPHVWPKGSRVVLLDSALRQLNLPSNARGVDRTYRVGPLEKPVDDAIFVQTRRAFAGAGLRPYAPVHVRAQRQEDGSVAVTWIRRTRIEGDGWQGPDVPIAEETEAYVVRVWKGKELVREVMTSSGAWIYDAVMQAADECSAPFSISIAQVSARFGPGPDGVVTVPQ